jgi:cytochrome c5
MSNNRARRAPRRPYRAPLSIVAALAALQVAGCGKSEAPDHELTQKLIQPVARVELKVAKVAPGSRTGQQIYESLCTSCHAAGVLGAPKTGDTAAWAPRLQQGLDTLVKHATEGLNAMPPRGGGADLTDTEVRRATVYLANSAGASFTEPPVEK